MKITEALRKLVAFTLIPDAGPVTFKKLSEEFGGIENIFKVFRVDALWRLTYPRERAIENFGFKFSFQFAL